MLAPGAYTAVVAGKGDLAGVGLWKFIDRLSRICNEVALADCVAAFSAPAANNPHAEQSHRLNIATEFAPHDYVFQTILPLITMLSYEFTGVRIGLTPGWPSPAERPRGRADRAGTSRRGFSRAGRREDRVR